MYVRHLARELVALGHEVDVLSGQPYPVVTDGVELVEVESLDLYRESDPFRVPKLREFRDLVDVLEFGVMCTAGFPEPLTFSLRALRLLQQRGDDYDVVHDNQTLGYGILGIERLGLPLVATIHHPITVDRRIDAAEKRTWRQRIAQRRWYGFLTMQARVARRIEHLLTVSASSLDDIVEDLGVTRGRVAVVPVGVDVETFRPRPEVARVPERIISTASSESPLKGGVILLEAVAKLRTERDVELVVIGRPRPDGVLADAITRFGLEDVVTFHHGISDDELATLLASATVAAVPSLYEGFSLPTAEAMACATPVVTTSAGALPEVVGDAGIIVEPGDASALAAGLRTVLDDAVLASELGARGRERVLEQFTWRRTAEATVARYREAIAAQAEEAR